MIESNFGWFFSLIVEIAGIILLPIKYFINLFIINPFPLRSMRFFYTLLSILSMNSIGAQVAPVSVNNARKLEILQSSRYNFQKMDSLTNLLSLAGKVILLQQGTLFYADSAVLNERTNIVEAFGNIHINDGDSIHTYCQYLRYRGNEKLAYLRSNVRLQDQKGTVLTTSELNYDMNTGMADYLNNGKVVNKKTTLTSKIGRYYEGTKDIIFSSNVLLTDPKFSIRTDSLQYNSQTEIATFIAPTTIITGKRSIITSSGYYDLKGGKAFFNNRSQVRDSTTLIVSDRMAFDDKEGFGQFDGNVVFSDTVNHINLLSNQLFVNNKTSSFLATQKPLLILVQDQDSTFITADTLVSGRITSLKNRAIPWLGDSALNTIRVKDLEGADSAKNRYFEAWNHVRIFSDSAQAVSDSMFFAATDSVFRLFRNPIAWSGDTQINADTMYLFTKNQQADRLKAFYNGFITSRINENAFNQVRGNVVTGSFKDGIIDYVRAKGRAELVYYAQDDNEKFIGLNRATSDAIDMIFKDKKAKSVKFIAGLEGVIYPITQIPPGEAQLKGFSWRDDLRPRSKFEMLGSR